MSINEKRILFIDSTIADYMDNKSHPVGGATVQTYAWISGFKYWDFSVFVLSNKIPNNQEGLTFIDLKNKFIKLSILWIPFIIIKLLFIIKKSKVQYLYASTAGWQTIIWGIVSRLAGINYIQRVSNNIVFDPIIYKKKLGFVKYHLSILGASNADLLLCQNEYQKLRCISLFRHTLCEILHNPFIELNEKVEQDFCIGTYVAWIGLFQYQKNMPALYSIAIKCPDLNFKIAGMAKTKLDDSTLNAIYKLKKLKNVEFVGMVSKQNINEFLNNSFCLLNTSHYEGFSNTFLEALSCGKPIVTRNNIDPDNFIRRNNLGLTSDNYEQIIESLYKAKKNQNEYFQRNKDYLYKFHNPNQLTQKLLSYLK